MSPQPENCAPRVAQAVQTSPPAPATRRIDARFVHAILTVTLAAAAQAQAELPPPLPHFDGASLVTVLDDARLHGVPTRIRQFKAAAPAATIRTFYLRTVEHAPIESEIDGWQVLAWKQGMHLLTVRLRACRSVLEACTEGTLSESDLSSATSDRSPGPDVPAGSVLSANLETDDAGRHAHILAWHEEASPAWAAARLVRQLSRQGLVLERRMPVARPGLRGESLWFGGRGREAIATILASGSGTTITLQKITHRGRSR